MVVKTNNSPPDDSYMIRCPRLGHQISFSYCQSENMGMPCFKILDCWFEYFDVNEYLKKKLNPEKYQEIINRPTKTKAQSLIELIEQTKNRE